MRSKPNPNSLCQHYTAAGRRCRMLLAPNHATLCAFHARAAAKALAAKPPRAQSIESVAADLLAGTENFTQPASVNLFLSNLLKNFAHHRISRRDATTLAYISQLLLNSQCVMHRQAMDAEAAQAQAQANQPDRIVIDMPGSCRRPHLDDDPDPAGATPFRASSDKASSEPSDPPALCRPLALSRRLSAPLENAAPVADTALPPASAEPAAAPPPATYTPTPDDPPPANHPRPIPLPRWAEPDSVTQYTYREPERPNTYGPPRMSQSRPPRSSSTSERAASGWRQRLGQKRQSGDWRSQEKRYGGGLGFVGGDLD